MNETAKVERCTCLDCPATERRTEPPYGWNCARCGRLVLSDAEFRQSHEEDDATHHQGGTP